MKNPTPSVPPPTKALTSIEGITPTSFSFNGHEIRALNQNDEFWFIAKDVCSVLGIKNNRQALSRLDDDEKHSVILNDTPLNIVNEFGLYTLILSSRKPIAKPFKRWVTHEVLPALNNAGNYSGSFNMETNTAQPPQLPAPIGYLDILEHDYKGHLIRVVKRPDGFWFMVKDLRRAVGLGKAKPERVMLYGNGSAYQLADFGSFKANIINEVGAVTMVSRSHKLEARALKKWLTGTLIPKLHKNPQELSPLPAADTAAIKALIVETLTDLILNNAQQGRK